MVPANNNKNLLQEEVWTQLAARAQSGDSRAFEQLLRDIMPFIKGVLGGTLSNHDAVDDIMQDVLISVHKSLGTYSADRPFKPWLAAIIGFRRTDYLRKHYRDRKNKEVSLDNNEFLGKTVTNVAVAGELKDIKSALDDMSETQRKIFIMMKIKGYSAKEVANEMGMSVSAVKVSAHRTMNKLKGKLQ